MDSRRPRDHTYGRLPSSLKRSLRITQARAIHFDVQLIIIGVRLYSSAHVLLASHKLQLITRHMHDIVHDSPDNYGFNEAH